MTTAIIYVRGHNEPHKEQQKQQCENYAKEKGYQILFTTDDINSVQNCDVLLVSHRSRISRKMIEYHMILKDLKAKNITLESVVGQNNTDDLKKFLADL